MSRVKKFEPAGGPGRLANRRGAEAKLEVEALLRRAGYQVGRRVPIGGSIYGTKLFADLLVRDSRRWPDGLIIEVVSQESHGSADQKFPYLVENIRACHPVPTVVVLIGCGFRGKALDWLHGQVDDRKLLAVVPLDRFEEWVAQSLAG